MADLFTIENAANLMVLIFLQAVLGFDNLLYISIESRRAPTDQQAKVRQMGIIIAVVLRLVLLFTMIQLLQSLKFTLFDFGEGGWIEGTFDFESVVFIFGGGFIMYTAIKEIHHLLAIQHLDVDVENRVPKSANAVIFMIVLMNLIFSFDSILSALAITEVFAVLAAAIITSGILMLVLADRVSKFIEKNRMYEVLGLFILLLVGVLLLSDGGEHAHLKFFGYSVEAMSKTTFYFSVAMMVILDVIQSRYQRKLLAQKAAEAQAGHA
ncbi:MAG: tellurium resistance protein TerC [Neomegalonema sp.]|nr:tellurium resistance protein TerC [Neomegalonema sp.]